MIPSNRNRSLVIFISKTSGEPWWWKHVDHNSLDCELEFQPVVLTGGRPAGVLSLEFMSLLNQCVSILWRARRRGYQYIFTSECDWTSFIVAGLQTALRSRQPRHVINQFIMREKTNTRVSRIKYAFMRWVFSSVYLCVCSSRSECDYYARAFRWPRKKLAFVPYHTDPAFLALEHSIEEPYVISAGRTFRDYATLLRAFVHPSPRLIIVASQSSIGDAPTPSSVEVMYDLSLSDLSALIARSMVVVLPLEDRQVSIGQSVLLQAMAMGKAVVATRVNGTDDYVEHMATGLLVPPYDPNAMRNAVATLMSDAGLRQKLGSAALARVKTLHLPDHYALGVSRALSGTPTLE